MRNLLIRLLTKASDTFIVKGVAGLKTNPRAVQFAVNYLLGTQEPLELTESEIDHTSWLLFNFSRVRQFMNDEAAVGEEITFYPYSSLFNDKGDVTLLKRYLTSETLGLVGAFSATNRGDHIECSDTWDFNDDTCFEFNLIGYHWILWLIGCVLSLFRLDWHLEYLSGDKSILTVDEADLIALNKSHQFTTTWTIPWQKMVCDIESTRINQVIPLQTPPIDYPF